MRYSTYLFIGREFEECATLVAQNILKNENAQLWQHFNALLWNTTNNDIEVNELVHLPVDENVFYPDESFLYTIGLRPQALFPISSDIKMETFFREWFQSHMPDGGKLLLNIVVSSSNKCNLEQAEIIARILNQTLFNYNVDLILLSPDLCVTLEKNEKEKKVLKENIHHDNLIAKQEISNLLTLRKEVHDIGQVILLENRRKGGGSYNLNLPILARIISEYAQVGIENYDNIFSQAQSIQIRQEEKVAAIGISCIDFDRYYFLNYMLHHAYLYIMKREGINQEIADVNKVANLAAESLESRTKVMTSFYERYIQPELDKGRSGDEIIRKGIMPLMSSFVKELEESITSHINDQNLSLPEKSAFIAQILLKDEDLLSGYLYNKNQPALLDLFREPVGFFIDHYNNSLEFKTDETGKIIIDENTGRPIIKDSILKGPQDEKGYVVAPFDQLKDLRMRIQQCSEFIRQRTEELEDLEKSRDAMKKENNVVIGNDNYFKRFKIIGDDIKEDPLQENYEPKPTNETNIDLSHDFTPVKNQGPVGACTTFAVTAVYEYILKKNDRQDYDLSERFLYYIAREKDERLDKEGASISTSIRIMGDKGICKEEIWPYSYDEYNTRPSDEAYSDAENRKVKKALNVVLSSNPDENCNALRSAIAEGYPVIISLSLFDAFDHIGKDGMVPIPSPGDTILQRPDSENKTTSSHAMVICGYDDKNQVFLVRNSWGEEFGKNGYCYIPYVYMCNHDFLNCAYIITEVTDESIKVRGINGLHKIKLDLSDVCVKISLTRNSIAAKKQEQQKLVEQYNVINDNYLELIEELRDPRIRENIIEQANSFYVNQSKEVESIKRKLEDDKGVQLDAFDTITVKNKTKWWIVWGGLLVLLGIITYFEGYVDYITIPLVCILVFGFIGFIRYSAYRKKKRDSLEAELDDIIVLKNRDLNKIIVLIKELGHRQHIAGMILDSLSLLSNNLHSLHSSLYNYLMNLSVWYDEEKNNNEGMIPCNTPPFISLIDNHLLDCFFEKEKEQLTREFRLFKIWEGEYVIDEREILIFKNKLKQKIKEELAKVIENFNVYDYISGEIQYPFLVDCHTKDIRSSLISMMDDHSKVFLAPINNNPYPAAHFVYVYCDEKWVRDWQRLCAENIEGGSPQCGYISSPYKVQELQLEYFSLDNIVIFTT